MFLAGGIDLSKIPHPVVVMEKSGEVAQRSELPPIPDEIAKYLLEIQNSRCKVLFCAFNEWDLRFSPLPKLLLSKGINVKVYDNHYVLRTENLFDTLVEKHFLTAYSLARIVQREALDLSSYQELIKDLSHLKRMIEQAINSLMTARAFPDYYHYPGVNKNW